MISGFIDTTKIVRNVKVKVMLEKLISFNPLDCFSKCTMCSIFNIILGIIILSISILIFAFVLRREMTMKKLAKVYNIGDTDEHNKY